MSEFSIKKATIERVDEHPDADRLELIFLKEYEYQLVGKKGMYNVGDTVVYFPEESMIPQDAQDALLGFKIDSKKGVRYKKLRGKVSQGLIVPANRVEKFLGESIEGIGNRMLTERLGVTRYRSPTVSSKNSSLSPLPSYLSKYDVENYENYSEAFEYLLDKPILITEKLEGTNWWASYDSREKVITVGQRNHTIKYSENNMYWRALKNQSLDLFLRNLSVLYPDSRYITIRGELVGTKIQGNYYRLNNQRVYLFCYETNCGRHFVSSMLEKLDSINWLEHIVPIVDFNKAFQQGKTLREILDGRRLSDYAYGKSQLNSGKLREGVVIQPLHNNINLPYVDVKQLKARCPIYLSQ